MRKWYRHTLAICLLVLVWAIHTAPLVRGNGHVALDDTGVMDLPNRLHAARMIRSGVFPHWTPKLLCGYPLFAAAETGVLYPFFLVYVVERTPAPHSTFPVLHVLLYGLFSYLFLATRTGHPSAGLIGAVVATVGLYPETQPTHTATTCYHTHPWEALLVGLRPTV